MNPLFVLGIGFISLGLVSAYLVIRLPRTYWLKWALIPLIIFCSVVLTTEIPSVLGYPVKGYPQKEFQLVKFVITPIDGVQTIQAWVVEGGKSRLYQFPFSVEVAQGLSKMAANAGNLRGEFHHTSHDSRGNVGNQDVQELSTIEIPQRPLPLKPD